jgi:hypothetical protein
MSSDNGAIAQSQEGQGLTLEQYAEAKHLRVDNLKGYGLQDMSYDGHPAVKMPYYSADGEETTAKFRLSMNGPVKSKFKAGTKSSLYGLWHLQGWRRDYGEEAANEFIWIVEGESCAQTLWGVGDPALGLPGAGNWNEQRDTKHLDGFENIFVLIEPDTGGENVLKWVGESSIRDRVTLVRLDGFKDISEMYLDDPDIHEFSARLDAAKASGEKWVRPRDELWAKGSHLAMLPNILDQFEVDIAQAGLVNELTNAKILFLVVLSQMLDRILSVVVKGSSSEGKSYLVDRVLDFFIASMYHKLTGMSEKALIYTDRDFRHIHLVFIEQSGMSGEMQSYLIRTLLSEGRLVYEVTIKGLDGQFGTQKIEKEGPTGCIVTTTLLNLHTENETRLISITSNDTPEQTKAIMLAKGRQKSSGQPLEPPDFEAWHALVEWVKLGSTKVIVPYGYWLSELIPPVAVRLRRDISTIFSLIETHALLHQVNRETDQYGSVIATLDDYGVVRELVDDALAEGVELTVPPEVRETVRAVAMLLDQWQDRDDETISTAQLKDELGLGKSATYRRASDAVERGYLKNEETRSRKPMKLILGNPLPNDQQLLPTVAEVASAWQNQGMVTPPPPGDAF